MGLPEGLKSQYIPFETANQEKMCGSQNTKYLSASFLHPFWPIAYPDGCGPDLSVFNSRIAAFATDMSNYTFASHTKGAISVHVTLLFRRAFKELMDQKGWKTPDIIMEQENIILEK